MSILDELYERGFIDRISREDGLAEHLSGKSVTFYAGFDPTADSLHVGSLALIMLMRRLRNAGHTPIVLVGGATAMIGDPSGKSEDRVMLDEETVRTNTDGVRSQIERILGGSVTAVNNLDWLADRGYLSFMREVASHFRVNEMIKAEGYRQRLEREEGLSFLEFSYQLIQAYDFLYLYREHSCSLQLGGADQWGNIAAGISLVRRSEGSEVYGVTLPLLTTAQGTKMGKTADGTIWLDPRRTSPYRFYQYWINIDDADVARFLRLFTELPSDEIETLAGYTGPDVRVAKERLADEVTALVHGEEEAREAREAATSVFSDGTADSEAVPSIELSRTELESGLSVHDLFTRAGLAESKSEVKRLIDQGGLAIDERPVAGAEETVTPDPDQNTLLLRRGKKRYCRVDIVS